MGRLPPTRKHRKKVSGREPRPVAAGTGRIQVRQVRSGSGKPLHVKRTLEALGLKHHQAIVVHKDHPAIRGMLYKVRHLVEVTPAKDGD